MESHRIANLLDLERDDIKKLKKHISYDVKVIYHPLLEYIARKYADQYGKIEEIEGVVFYR